MQNVLLGILPFLALVQGPSPDGPTLDLVPQEGVVLRRTFVAKHDLALEGFRQRLDDGEPVDLPGGARFTSEQRFVFDDQAGSSVGLVPKTLRRRFIALESKGILAPSETPSTVQATALSPLVGASVLMTWIPAEQNHGRYYDGREEAESLLPGLLTDPWLTWIKGAEVAENGSWKVPAHKLRGLIAPGGDLGFSPGTERAGRRLSRTLVNGVGGGLEMAFGGRSSGELTVRPLGVQTNEAGDSHLVFALSLDARWVSDVSDRLNQTLLAREREQGSSFEQASLTLGLTGRGQLLCNATTGKPESLELNCTESVSMKISERLETGSLFHQDMGMRGRLVITQKAVVRP